MLIGTVTMLDALLVAISSMFVVFTVLLILFVIVRMFPVVFKDGHAQKASAAADASASAAQVAAEQAPEVPIAVIAAAVMMHRKKNSRRINPMVRNYE